MSIESFERWLHCTFCEYWDFVKDIDSLTISRDFGDGVETIKISNHNDFWYVTLKVLDRTNEIFTPKTINAHNEEKLSKETAYTIGYTFIKAIEEIDDVEIKHLGNISYGTVVEKEKCNIKYPHIHHYITNFVLLKTKDVDSVKPFIMCRYEFFKRD
jgi:hypothetical protein